MKQISFGHLQLSKQGKLLKSNFTINRPQSLFGPDWSMLKQSRCPHCFNRLTMVPSQKGLMRCKSKKHKKPFFIHTRRIKEILDGRFGV